MFRESFCESEEGVRLPRETGDLREVRGVRETSGEVWETSGEPLNNPIAIQFHSERTSGEVAENFRESSGNFRGSPGTFHPEGLRRTN